MSGTFEVASVATALASGLVGGVFFAFSSFVMGALGRLPVRGGIAAMQSINVVVITPAFMLPLFGSALAMIALVIVAAGDPGERQLGLIAVAAALYSIGTVGVTMAANVPLNNRLDAVGRDDRGAEELWRHYLNRWTAWNTVRTAAALAASATLIVAIGA